MAKAHKKVDLGSLVIGTLPEHVLKSLSEMDITIDDLQTWDTSRSGFFFTRQNGKRGILIHVFIPIAKVLIWSGALGTIIGILGNVIRFFRGLRGS